MTSRILCIACIVAMGTGTFNVEGYTPRHPNSFPHQRSLLQGGGSCSSASSSSSSLSSPSSAASSLSPLSSFPATTTAAATATSSQHQMLPTSGMDDHSTPTSFTTSGSSTSSSMSISSSSSHNKNKNSHNSCTRQSRKKQTRGEHWKLSNSVLASCDTLPAFPTAHGILSPETVSRMEQQQQQQQTTSSSSSSSTNMAVRQFLKEYHRKGPMACLPMLSDPDVLPHLTKAMRDVSI